MYTHMPIPTRETNQTPHHPNLQQIMDVPGIGQARYETFDELYLYCYRVAGTVGLMTLPIMGTAPGYTEKQATEPALALGIALQVCL